MFEFDGSKFLIIGIVALLVIGPKDLPRVLRQIGQWTGKLRRMAAEFRGQFMDAMREADIDTIKKEVRGIADTARVDTRFNPLADIRREIGGIKSDLSSSLTGNKAAEPVVETAAVAMPHADEQPSVHGSDQQQPTRQTAELLRPQSHLALPAPGAVGSLPRRVPSTGSKSSPS